MVDAALIWKDGKADILLENNDLQTGNDLIAAVVTSLFEDARATIEDVGTEEDLRGWWSQERGSLIWLLDREKISNEIIEQARTYAKDSLNWLVVDGIASEITVSAVRSASYAISLDVNISRGNNTRYNYLWDGLTSLSYEFNQTVINISFS